MLKPIFCACAVALCLVASPAPAKEGCGSGLHMNNKGHCVPNKKSHANGNPCPAHHHMGPNGHCRHN